MNSGDIYHDEIRVVSYGGCLSVEVEFLSTGYRTITTSQHVRDNKVKDRMKPSVYGVGFLGGTEYKTKTQGKVTPAYAAWRCMLQRCFDEKWRSSNPYYYGVTVCDEWLNFQTFARWFYCNLPDGAERVQLDKDAKSESKDLYSPETCSLLTQAENVRESNFRADYSKRRRTSKNYMITTPHGDSFEINNLAAFCRRNDLDASKMCLVANGKREHHKRWKAVLL